MSTIEQELVEQVNSLSKVVENQATDYEHHIKYLLKTIDSQRRLIDKFRVDFKLIQVVVGEGIRPASSNSSNFPHLHDRSSRAVGNELN